LIIEATNLNDVKVTSFPPFSSYNIRLGKESEISTFSGGVFKVSVEFALLSLISASVPNNELRRRDVSNGTGSSIGKLITNGLTLTRLIILIVIVRRHM
jgi:hypothetical protein